MSAAALRWFSHRPEPLGEASPYGARELQRLQARFLLQSLAISCVFGVAVALLLAQMSYLWRQGPILEDPWENPEGTKVDVLPEPTVPLPPPPPPSGPISTHGVPVAVADAFEDTALVYAPEPALDVGPEVTGNQDPGGSISGSGSGGNDEEPDPDPTVWHYYEELPVPVTHIPPDYPDIAKRAGMEGHVTVRALVGLDGQVQDVLIIGSPSIFDDEAMRAVRRWVFTPAKVNGRPVRAWVSVPVRFELR